MIFGESNVCLICGASLQFNDDFETILLTITFEVVIFTFKISEPRLNYTEHVHRRTCDGKLRC